LPIFEEDGFVLFKSSAIVLHPGERSKALLAKNPRARDAMAHSGVQFLFVLNVALIRSITQTTNGRSCVGQGPWRSRRRLSALSRSLGDKRYVDSERFTAGDLMTTTVLRIPAS